MVMEMAAQRVSSTHRAAGALGRRRGDNGVTTGHTKRHPSPCRQGGLPEAASARLEADFCQLLGIEGKFQEPQEKRRQPTKRLLLSDQGFLPSQHLLQLQAHTPATANCQEIAVKGPKFPLDSKFLAVFKHFPCAKVQTSRQTAIRAAGTLIDPERRRTHANHLQAPRQWRRHPEQQPTSTSCSRAITESGRCGLAAVSQRPLPASHSALCPGE